ncbi:MAG: hypothetical protein WC635_05205 [Bacteriovorax sp.]|jgi:hypothetical protein
MKLKIIFTILALFLNVSCKDNSDAAGSSAENYEAIHRGEYRIGLYKGGSDFDLQKITHIIVVGSAVKEDSDQFFQSGLSRAYRYKELWPEHNVVIMSSPDVKGATDEEIFKKYKIPVVKQVNKKFTADLLLDELSAFPQIASLDFFGHSSPWAMKIGKSNAAFDTTKHTDKLLALRKNFLSNAYVTLNACNTGFYLAPALSKALALPVSGSLTSSMFERIESDGYWYKEEDWKDRSYLKHNKVSFKKEVSCAQGVCTRMRAARSNYSSYWGTFSEGGLSFDKFFCNYESNQDGSCERGMATSLLSFPSLQPIDLNSSSAEYKRVVFDWLCSTGKTESYFSRCVTGIETAVERGDLEYQSHPTAELVCDFTSCHAEVVCKYGTFDDLPIEGSCKLRTFQNPKPTNAATEYISLMKGFEQIKIK